MPELPEVENFRRLLLPLISSKHSLVLERCSLEKAPPRKFITDEEINDIVESRFVVAEVLRKGKLICLVLNVGNATRKREKIENRALKYLFLHMGMTGRISTPDCIPKLKELSDTDIYPPPYTYLRMIAGSNQACFSDPRKFGAIFLKDCLEEDFDILAPDAWTSTCLNSDQIIYVQDDGPKLSSNESTMSGIVGKLSEQSMGIKGVLLDQKRALSGVGNWVADEVLYQTKMHPDQNRLTKDEAETLLRRLHFILDEAIQCLDKKQDFPPHWLFHYRWNKRGSSKSIVKDAKGRHIAFVTSGGRTSAVVTSIQKKWSRKLVAATPRKELMKKDMKTKKRVLSTTITPPPNTVEAESNETRKSTKKAKKNSLKDSEKQLRDRKEKTENLDGVKRQTTARRSPRFLKS